MPSLLQFAASMSRPPPATVDLNVGRDLRLRREREAIEREIEREIEARRRLANKSRMCSRCGDPLPRYKSRYCLFCLLPVTKVRVVDCTVCGRKAVIHGSGCGP